MCDTNILNAIGLDQTYNVSQVRQLIANISSVRELLQILCNWQTQEFFLDCDQRIFNTGTDFIDLTQYQDPVQNKTAAQFVQTLLNNIQDMDNEFVHNLSQNFQDYTRYFSFPFISAVNATNVTLVLQLPIESNSLSSNSIQSWLHHFYGDSMWGAFTLEFQDSMTELSDPLYIENSIARSSTFDVNFQEDGRTTTLLRGYTIQVKLSFLMSLYQLIAEQTRTGNVRAFSYIQSLTTQQFKQIRVDESVPLPAIGRSARTDFCVDKTDCACSYFAVFRSIRTSPSMPLTTPAHNLYVNRFQEPNCLCYISRAVPNGESGVLNPFGMCFDQNCLDPSVDKSGLELNCSDQCKNARQTLDDVNWQNNFVNPATVSRHTVETTCGFPVAPISYDLNRWSPSPYLVAGAACLTLSVPLYVGVKSLMQKQYTFSGWHIVFFLGACALSGLVMYSLVGKFRCVSTVDQLDQQAQCFDRLTGLWGLSKECCDNDAPIFCQCDPENSSQQVCRSAVATAFCKCQNNGLCLPTSGNSDVVNAQPEMASKYNMQHVFACIGVFALLAPLATLGTNTLLTKWNVGNWMWRTIVLMFVILVTAQLVIGVPLILSYQFAKERTWTLNLEAQAKTCSTDTT